MSGQGMYLQGDRKHHHREYQRPEGPVPKHLWRQESTSSPTNTDSPPSHSTRGAESTSHCPA